MPLVLGDSKLRDLAKCCLELDYDIIKLPRN